MRLVEKSVNAAHKAIFCNHVGSGGDGIEDVQQFMSQMGMEVSGVYRARWQNFLLRWELSPMTQYIEVLCDCEPHWGNDPCWTTMGGDCLVLTYVSDRCASKKYGVLRGYKKHLRSDSLDETGGVDWGDEIVLAYAVGRAREALDKLWHFDPAAVANQTLQNNVDRAQNQLYRLRRMAPPAAVSPRPPGA
jgi:hypothetical protein